MSSGIIRQLRDVVPIRPLTRLQALSVAELQANRFLKLAGVTAPPVPARLIAELPRVQVVRMTPFPHSGVTNWENGRWLIVLRGSDILTRQRFSLAHEFKHILDDRFAKVIYRGEPPEERQDWIEKVCEYFGGCLLMPRMMVKRAYCGGRQRLPELARHFDVSQRAMRVRLEQIGLLDPSPRCDRPTVATAADLLTPKIEPFREYRRALAPVFT